MSFKIFVQDPSVSYGLIHNVTFVFRFKLLCLIIFDLDYLKTKSSGYQKTLEYLLSTKFSKITYPFYQRKLLWWSQKHLRQIWNDAYCLFFSLVRLLYFIVIKRQIQLGMGSFRTRKQFSSLKRIGGGMAMDNSPWWDPYGMGQTQDLKVYSPGKFKKWEVLARRN